MEVVIVAVVLVVVAIYLITRKDNVTAGTGGGNDPSERENEKVK